MRSLWTRMHCMHCEAIQFTYQYVYQCYYERRVLILCTQSSARLILSTTHKLPWVFCSVVSLNLCPRLYAFFSCKMHFMTQALVNDYNANLRYQIKLHGIKSHFAKHCCIIKISIGYVGVYTFVSFLLSTICDISKISLLSEITLIWLISMGVTMWQFLNVV